MWQSNKTTNGLWRCHFEQLELMIENQLFVIAFNMKLQGWWEEQVKEPVLQRYTRHLLWSLLVAEGNYTLPGTLQFCDSVARRENKQKVRHLRRHFDIVYWNQNHPFRVTHRTNDFTVHPACKRTKEFSNRICVFIRPTFPTLSLNKKFEAALTHDIRCISVFTIQGVHHGKPFQKLAQLFVGL